MHGGFFQSEDVVQKSRSKLTLAITLSQNNRAHKDLNRTHIAQRRLTLAQVKSSKLHTSQE